MKMKKAFSILFVLALMMSLTYNVFAQEDPVDKDTSPGIMGAGMMHGRGPMMANAPGGPRMMGGMGGMMLSPAMMDRLELTKEQKDNIESILTSLKKDMIRKNADLALANIELQELIQKDKPDMNLIKDQLQKIANINVDVQYTQIKTQMDVKNILTDEQKANLEKFAKERRTGMANKKAKSDRSDQRQKPDVRPNNRPR
jgi:Spy/CpxP family protein refolding chaperone